MFGVTAYTIDYVITTKYAGIFPRQDQTARLPSFILPGQPKQVILRSNNRTEILCAEADYRFYLDKLR